MGSYVLERLRSLCRLRDESLDQMQARILGGKRTLLGKNSFEVGSEMARMQRRLNGGRRESVRMWGNWPDVDFEEDAWRDESPPEQH